MPHQSAVVTALERGLERLLVRVPDTGVLRETCPTEINSRTCAPRTYKEDLSSKVTQRRVRAVLVPAGIQRPRPVRADLC